MNTPTRRVRVTRSIISHLEGSHAWQVPGDTSYNDPESLSLMAKLKVAPTRADGSCTVELDRAEREVLAEYVEVQAIGAGDQVHGLRMGDEFYAECLGELNACRALLRQLAKIEHTERVIDRCSS